MYTPKGPPLPPYSLILIYYFSALLEGFPPQIQQRINLDMEGFAKSSFKQYTTYGIMVLIRFCYDNNLELNMQSILEFSRELQKSKKAATPVAAAFAMYRIFCSALCIEIPSSEVVVYKARIKIHTKAFNARDNKKWRYPIPLNDITTLWDNPPKNCSTTHWQAFLSLSWVFLLRKNEAFSYQNGDLKRNLMTREPSLDGVCPFQTIKTVPTKMNQEWFSLKPMKSQRFSTPVSTSWLPIK